MPQPAAPTLRLGFAGLPDTPLLHVSVDGMTEAGPNLSHWPGNRTPARWKADLSSGICLNYSRAEPEAKRIFLGGATTVLNDHYDTDGFGSLLAVLRPDVAMAREELLLAAAATGDFGTFHTWRSFAIDRIVARLADDASPAAAEFRGVEGPARSLLRYRWLLDHAEQVLDHPESFAPLWHDELRLVREEIDAGRRGALQRRRSAELGLAVLESAAPQRRMTLNTLAGGFRVLHTETSSEGPLHRYHDRTESWFELATFHAPPRRDLRPLQARLAALEPPRDGASWCADPPTAPIPELWFGEPAAQDYGSVTRVLRPSRLSASVVERHVAAHLAEPAA